jgi:hypothetical protein
LKKLSGINIPESATTLQVNNYDGVYFLGINKTAINNVLALLDAAYK